VRRDDISSSDGAHTSVGGKDNNGGQSAFKGSVKEGETFDIKHMNFIDEENSWDEFGNTLINVFVDNFIDFSSELFSNFGLLGLHNLSHQRKEILTSLGLGVGNIQIVEGNILNYFFLLVNITFGKRDILFSFQIVFGSISIASSDSFDVSTGSFNVDNITNLDFFLLHVFINAGVKLELLGSLGGLQCDDDTGDDLSIS